MCNENSTLSSEEFDSSIPNEILHIACEFRFCVVHLYSNWHALTGVFGLCEVQVE
jgi:hypothetical protein